MHPPVGKRVAVRNTKQCEKQSNSQSERDRELTASLVRTTSYEPPPRVLNFSQRLEQSWETCTGFLLLAQSTWPVVRAANKEKKC